MNIKAGFIFIRHLLLSSWSEAKDLRVGPITERFKRLTKKEFPTKLGGTEGTPGAESVYPAAFFILLPGTRKENIRGLVKQI